MSKLEKVVFPKFCWIDSQTPAHTSPPTLLTYCKRTFSYHFLPSPLSVSLSLCHLQFSYYFHTRAFRCLIQNYLHFFFICLKVTSESLSVEYNSLNCLRPTQHFIFKLFSIFVIFLYLISLCIIQTSFKQLGLLCARAILTAQIAKTKFWTNKTFFVCHEALLMPSYSKQIIALFHFYWTVESIKMNFAFTTAYVCISY